MDLVFGHYKYVTTAARYHVIEFAFVRYTYMQGRSPTHMHMSCQAGLLILINNKMYNIFAHTSKNIQVLY